MEKVPRQQSLNLTSWEAAEKLLVKIKEAGITNVRSVSGS